MEYNLTVLMEDFEEAYAQVKINPSPDAIYALDMSLQRYDEWMEDSFLELLEAAAWFVEVLKNPTSPDSFQWKGTFYDMSIAARGENGSQFKVGPGKVRETIEPISEISDSGHWGGDKALQGIAESFAKCVNSTEDNRDALQFAVEKAGLEKRDEEVYYSLIGIWKALKKN